MKNIHLLDQEERELYFRTAADKKGLPIEIIEKDFWVVWTLRVLFSLESLEPHLTFKGGTSLSKVYGVIERFSEDIDLAIERSFLSCKSLEPGSSNSQRDRVPKKIKKKCTEYVQGPLYEELKQAIRKELTTGEEWELSLSPDDGGSLLFKYPTKQSKNIYTPPHVILEMGACADSTPSSKHRVRSYVKEVLGSDVSEHSVEVRVLDIEKTFWEKAIILHQYSHWPENKADSKKFYRKARHYYDFFCLLNHKAKEQALSKDNLLEEAAAHNDLYYRYTWANHETPRRGTLSLIPPANILQLLQNDYHEMDGMFFNKETIPKWEEIIETIQSFQEEFNNGCDKA